MCYKIRLDGYRGKSDIDMLYQEFYCDFVRSPDAPGAGHPMLFPFHCQCLWASAMHAVYREVVKRVLR